MKELSQKLERLIETAVEKEEIAGANIVVIRDGQEMAFAADGYADIEAGKKYERDTIARLYSMTKPVTSAAAMLLMERGLLDPGAFVEEFLPGFHNAIVASGGKLVPTVRPVRICDLLNMTSGLMYGGDVTSVCSMETEKLFDRIKEHLYLEDAMTTQEVANRLGLIPLQFQPGESFQYGTSADVLGAVIEVISGKTFGEFLKEEFFEPLDMEDTAFYVPENKQERLAKVYQRTEQGLELYTENHLGIMNAMKQVPAFESGGAGLVSTLDDYAKFAAMLLQEGSYQGKQILKPQTVHYMTNGSLMSWQQEVLDQCWEGIRGYTYANLLRNPERAGKISDVYFHRRIRLGWLAWGIFLQQPERPAYDASYHAA